MKTFIYTIYDKVAQESGPLFTAKNDDVALRNYHQLMASQRLNPFDYKLLNLGIYESDPVSIRSVLVPVEVETPSAAPPLDIPASDD